MLISLLPLITGNHDVYHISKPKRFANRVKCAKIPSDYQQFAKGDRYDFLTRQNFE